MSLLASADPESIAIAQFFRSVRREMRSAAGWSLFLGALTFGISFLLSDVTPAFLTGAVAGGLLFLAGLGLLLQRSPAMLRLVALAEGAAGLWQMAAAVLMYMNSGRVRGGAVVLGIVLLLRARNHLSTAGPFASAAAQADMEVVRELDALCSDILGARIKQRDDVVEFTTGGFFSRSGWRAARLPGHIVFLKFAEGYHLGRKAEEHLIMAAASAVGIEPVGDSAFGSKIRLVIRIGEEELRDVSMPRHSFDKFQFWTSAGSSFSTVAASPG